jgi:hypothetical protein
MQGVVLMFLDERDKYIQNAIHELISIFGVSENVSLNIPFSFKKSDVGKYVKAVAMKMGMSIKVDISYVSKGYSSSSGTAFKSSQLARTDATGRGIESITAQVIIPENMPLYGSKDFNNNLINIRVSENCLEKPETFVTIIAHELSHVLLKSVRHPKANDEIYADLMPIILGFGEIVKVGRKVISYSFQGNREIKHTVTYGYFTDSEFDVVVSTIMQIVTKRKNEKELILSKMSRLKEQCVALKDNLQKLKSFIGIVDMQHRKSINKQDNIRIVQMHSLDYFQDIELGISNYQKEFDSIKMHIQQLICYTNSSVKKMREYSDSLTNIGIALDEKCQVVKKDLEILKRNMRFLQRIKMGIKDLINK